MKRSGLIKGDNIVFHIGTNSGIELRGKVLKVSQCLDEIEGNTMEQNYYELIKMDLDPKSSQYLRDIKFFSEDVKNVYAFSTRQFTINRVMNIDFILDNLDKLEKKIKKNG